MLRLHTPADAGRLADVAMRDVILQRFAELAEVEDYAFDELAAFWLIEPGDTIETLEAVTGLPIGHRWCSDARYGEPGFSSGWDVLAAHATCFEMVFVTSDDGYGVVLWIPQIDADPTLLRMCAEYAAPG